jgi:NTP pyrophosphatase (non-canonical NTP hydrolase)
MNFQQYVQTVRLRCKQLDHKDQIDHAKIGMITELGELGDLLKRAFVYGKEFDPVNLLEEVGDFLWYFVLYLDEIRMHAAEIDAAAARAQVAVSNEGGRDSEISYCFALSLFVGNVASHGELPQEAHGMAAEGVLMICLGLLRKHGFTLEQCLDTNDAKLEKRTGKAFNAAAILDRDVAAERAILEGGANG